MVLYDAADTTLNPDRLKELAQLRFERASLEKSLEVAVLVGIYCEKNYQDKIEFVMEKLGERFDAGGYTNLPKTMIETIGGAIPEKHRNSLFILIKRLVKENVTNNEAITSQNNDYLGRLQEEKHKWDRSLETAIMVGIRCEELDQNKTKIQRDMLKDFINHMKINLSQRAGEKIWKAIPSEYRQTRGHSLKFQDKKPHKPCICDR